MTDLFEYKKNQASAMLDCMIQFKKVFYSSHELNDKREAKSIPLEVTEYPQEVLDAAGLKHVSPEEMLAATLAMIEVVIFSETPGLDGKTPIEKILAAVL